jgi:uncharacterized protein (TIGR02453 family)
MSSPDLIFKKDLFQFLVELKFNNERAWFLANKSRYERDLKMPMMAFTEAFLGSLKKINPAYDHVRLFRIYRDVRFSKDKTPYKTHVAAQFMHRAARTDVHAPGIYLHLEPGESFLGGGVWSPESTELKKIRNAIMARPQQWAPLSKLPLWGESYLRPPKGIDPKQRFLSDLKRKHFITWVDFKDKDVLAPHFFQTVQKACRKVNPLIVFLNNALGLK